MIRDQVFSNFELRKTMNLSCRLTFYSKKDHPVPWVRLVCFHVNEACYLKAKTFTHGLLLKVLWKLAFKKWRHTCM